MIQKRVSADRGWRLCVKLAVNNVVAHSDVTRVDRQRLHEKVLMENGDNTSIF